MKISMWMIAEKLNQYQPNYHIEDGTACITGVRFISEKKQTDLETQYVYWKQEEHGSRSGSAFSSITLINGRDRILLQGEDINEILNDLLAVFDFYNSWETSLWEASANKSFQQIIDLGNTVLENPMMVSDMDGHVLAMSSAFLGEDINEYWIESRESSRIPAAILGAPIHTLDGSSGSWSNAPEIYVMPDGTKTIGTYISVNGNLIAGFGLWEHKRPIMPSDIWLVKVLYDVLASTIEAQKRSAPLRSSSAIIADLLAGIQIDSELVDKLEPNCKRPWQLLVIANPFRHDELYKRNLLRRLQTLSIPCIPLLYEDHVLALVSQDSAETVLHSVIGIQEKKYYLAILSLPFINLRDITLRYEQTCFAIQQIDKIPGVYYGEAFAFSYLLSLFTEQNRKQGLIHPALDKLKQYDAEKNTELYETFYQYLLNERSILLGAQAMHIHKNSFLYRLQRIRALIDVDLENPMQRIFLLISYFLEKN